MPRSICGLPLLLRSLPLHRTISQTHCRVSAAPHTQITEPGHRHHRLPPALHQLRAPHRQITLQRLYSRSAQRTIFSLYRPSLSPARAPGQDANPPPAANKSLPPSNPPGIQCNSKNPHDRAAPARPRPRRSPGRAYVRPLQHLANLAFRKRFRQHLPARWRLHVHRRIMISPLIHQQPAVKPTQTTQFPRNRPRLHRMAPQSFHKPTHIRLRRPHQQPIAPFHMLGKLL